MSIEEEMDDLPRLDARFIGRRGAKRFSTLCSDEGVTCNQSSEDDSGWDMLVEFPRVPQPLVALDMQDGVIAASVQLKATQSSARTVQIRLSNALHQVRSPLPSFVILVVLDGDRTRYFGKHVWLPLIGSWVEAARKADAAGVVATNLEYLRLRFDKEDEKGDEILGWMKREIDSVSRPYATAKQKIVDTIGFEPMSGTGSIHFVLDGRSDFIDFQLGLKPSIRASSFTFTTERFGIAAGKPEIDLRDVDIIVTPQGQNVLLRFDFPRVEAITVPGKFYRAEQGGVHALRISACCFEWIYRSNDELNVRTHLEPSSSIPIDDLLFYVLCKASAKGAPIPFEVELNGKPIPLGTMSLNQDDGQRDAWGHFSLALAALRSIIRVGGRPGPLMSFTEVSSAEKCLHIIAAVAGSVSLLIDFVPSIGAPRRFSSFLAYGCAKVGGQIYAAVGRRPITGDRKAGNKRRIKLGSAQILRAFSVPEKEWDPKILVDAYQRHLDLLSSEGEILAIGDLANIVDGGTEQVLFIDKPTAH